jgi:hypothetical protein
VSEVERVTSKGGKRTYKSNRPKAPVTSLIPIAIDTLRSMFPTNGESPSVTTVLGVMAKPALIGWAAREERKMVAAYADKLYRELQATIEGAVDAGMFAQMLHEQLGKGAHLQLLAKASNVGSQVHARIEWEFKGELGRDREAEAPPLTSDQAVRAFDRWTEWRAQVKMKLLDTEKKLYSSVFGFGGTLDFIAEIEVPDPKLALLGPAERDTNFPVPLVKLKVVGDFKTGKSIYAESFLQNVAYRMALKEEGIDTDGGIIIRLPKYEDDPEFEAKMIPDDPLLAPTFLALLVVYRWWEKQHPLRSRSKRVDNTPKTVLDSETPNGN